MMDSRDVLPLPLGPISASTSPGLQQPVMLNRICGCTHSRRALAINQQQMERRSAQPSIQVDHSSPREQGEQARTGKAQQKA